MKGSIRKRSVRAVIAAGLCVAVLFAFSGCSILNILNDIVDAVQGENGIGAVRKKMETWRQEQSEKLIAGIKSRDTEGVKALFCPKSQGLAEIDGQIERSFDFMDGAILSYQIKKSLSYEGYANDYGKVTEYEFNSDIYITTDTGRKYLFYFAAQYLVEPEIEGMTDYAILEWDKEYEERTVCRAGYGWSSPYDGECGVLAARLITSLAKGDADGVKSLFCAEALGNGELDGQIESAISFFDGNPLFTERADGLYNNYHGEGENDFYYRTLGYEIDKGTNGDMVGVWVSSYVHSVYTDAGKDYTLFFTAYLVNEQKPQWAGISCFSLENRESEQEISVGGWIH